MGQPANHQPQAHDEYPNHIQNNAQRQEVPAVGFTLGERRLGQHLSGQRFAQYRYSSPPVRWMRRVAQRVSRRRFDAHPPFRRRETVFERSGVGRSVSIVLCHVGFLLNLLTHSVRSLKSGGSPSNLLKSSYLTANADDSRQGNRIIVNACIIIGEVRFMCGNAGEGR
ncbi:MAG: hypothetical protein J07HQX50_02135 [Haloquadratum sp. J07HQX50]|nr:MAG: hypothetical protein J07HQX50_02135 [Haloquadratum sp. J07HQX50]